MHLTRTATTVLALLTSLSLPTGNALAGDVASKSIEAAVDAGFSEFERQLIYKYFGRLPADDDHEYRHDEDYGGHDKHKGGKGMPPGLAKRGGALPPGLAKRETLPPGLARRALPEDLERELPPPPAGYERRIVEDAAIVLINKATGEVADIIKDAVLDKR